VANLWGSLPTRRRPDGKLRALVVAIIATVAAALLPMALAGPAQAAATCPCSLWADSVTPTNVDSGDANSVELGTMFTSDVDGAVTGVRFYKSTANDGTHIGSLWATDGTLLAQVTFTNETDSGWQQASFSAPVPITAGTQYVISYHAPDGHYSDDGAYFANSGYDAAPLHAPGGSGSNNGLFAYSPTPVYPDGSFNSTNYWVSPVVTTSPAAPTLASIAVTPSTVSVQAGQTTQLTATGTYSDGSTADLTGAVTWTATGSATVSATGLVTGTSAGTATVTATQGSVSGSAAVTVTAVPVTLKSIAVTPAAPKLIVGLTQQMTATGTYSDGSTRALTTGVTWTSSSTATATISSAGVLTPKAAGTTTVTATVGSVSGSTAATVRTIRSITLSPALKLSITAKPTQLTATATLSDGSSVNITTSATWTSTLPGIATVSSTGLVTPKFIGATVIKATIGSVSGLSTIVVI
jgi:hypothetical protein